MKVVTGLLQRKFFIFFIFMAHLVSAESLFDKLIKDNNVNSKKTKVPYPISKLVDDINNKVYSDGLRLLGIVKGVGGTHFSGQNELKQDYLATLFAAVHPGRINEGKRDYLVKDRLFLYYEEKRKRLDIISFNLATNKFDFQSVKNYTSNGENIVSYAEKDNCLKCHNNALPIFNKKKYLRSENTKTLTRLKREINKGKRFNDDKNPRRVEKLDNQIFYNGVYLHDLDKKAELFNTHVEKAKDIIYFNKAWEIICSSKLFPNYFKKCRSELLYYAYLLSLSPGKLNTFFKSQKFVEFKEKTDASLQAKNVKIKNLDNEINRLVFYLSEYFNRKETRLIRKHLDSVPVKNKWKKYHCKKEEIIRTWSNKVVLSCSDWRLSYVITKSGSLIDGSLEQMTLIQKNNLHTKKGIPLKLLNRENKVIRFIPQNKIAQVSLTTLIADKFDLFVIKPGKSKTWVELSVRSLLEGQEIEKIFAKFLVFNMDNQGRSLSLEHPRRSELLSDLLMANRLQ